MKILLNTKIIKIKQKRSKKTVLLDKLQKTTGSINYDFFNIVYDSLSKNLNQCFKEDLNRSRMYQILKVEKDDSLRNIYGLMGAGEKGISADLVENSHSGINHKHKRTLEEYELLKFFFLIHIPKAGNGFIILQSNSRQSIYSSIKDRLYHILYNFNREFYTIDINKYYTKKVLYEILERATIHDIRFISHDVSKDFADLENATTEKCVAMTQFTRLTKDVKEEIFGKNLKKLKKGMNVAGGIEFDVGHGYDDIKVSITDNNKTRLLSVTQDEFDIDEDITDSLLFDADGNPQYTSIKKIAIDKLNDLC